MLKGQAFIINFILLNQNPTLFQQKTVRLPKELTILSTSCWDFYIVNRLLSASTRWCAWTSRLRRLASVWSWCLLSARWATFKAPQSILVRIKKSPLDFSRLTEGRPGAKKETLTPIYDHPSLRKKYNWIGRENFQKINLEYHYRGKVFYRKNFVSSKRPTGVELWERRYCVKGLSSARS